MDFLSHLRADSARFAEVLSSLGPSTSVPCCPEWGAGDLLWHLTEVQWFWGTIVADRLTDPDAAENAKPDRPSGHEDALELFGSATARLHEALASTPPDTHVWTWHDTDQTAGFVRRRQAHEALIHRADAEQSAGLSPAVEPELAVDGVDEILRVMMGGVPQWATFEPDGASVRIEATDYDRHWGLAFGRMLGTSPSSGNAYDLDAVTIGLDAPTAGTTIAGPAGDLDLWLWGRQAPDGLEIDGDVSLAERLRRLAVESTQ